MFKSRYTNDTQSFVNSPTADFFKRVQHCVRSRLATSRVDFETDSTGCVYFCWKKSTEWRHQAILCSIALCIPCTKSSQVVHLVGWCLEKFLKNGHSKRVHSFVGRLDLSADLIRAQQRLGADPADGMDVLAPVRMRIQVRLGSRQLHQVNTYILHHSCKPIYCYKRGFGRGWGWNWDWNWDWDWD